MGDNDFCILVDTVGFISKLPHELVESFSSTLEEVKSADLILHVVDVSDKFYKRNIDITNKVLDEFEATTNRLIILNKSDLLSGPIEIEENQILFSIKNKQNIDRLKGVIKDMLK